MPVDPSPLGEEGARWAFDVAIEEVRDATEDEVKHGHAHPPGQEAH
ncbi:hypothetical protein [Frateuria sp.]